MWSSIFDSVNVCCLLSQIRTWWSSRWVSFGVAVICCFPFLCIGYDNEQNFSGSSHNGIITLRLSRWFSSTTYYSIPIRADPATSISSFLFVDYFGELRISNCQFIVKIAHSLWKQSVIHISSFVLDVFCNELDDNALNWSSQFRMLVGTPKERIDLLHLFSPLLLRNRLYL